jgi:curved DNA-binding protein CbpA
MAEAEKVKNISDEDIPLLCEGTDIMEFDVTPEEGYILGRIDGSSNVVMLLESSGLGRDKTKEIINSLVEKNVIIFKETQYRPDAEVKSDSDTEKNKTEKTLKGQNDIVTASDIKKIKLALRKQKLPKGEKLKKLIEDVFSHLEQFSYYDLLGVNTKTEPKKIKKAYLIRTKSFHPDRFYRSVDEEFKKKIQELFKQVNKGYKILSDPESKEEYDSLLSDEDILDDAEEILLEANRESRTRTVKGEASPWKRIKVAKQKDIREVTRKKKVEKNKKPSGTKLKLDFKNKNPGSPLLKKINKIKKKGMKGQVEQAKRLYQGAMHEIEQGSLSAAAINLKLAIQYDPGNKEYKEATANLESIKESKKATERFHKGVAAQKGGDLSLALQLYKDALRFGYETAELYHKMAEIIIASDGNFEKARTFVLKSIEMEEGVASFHITLARIYVGLEQYPAARIQYNKVLKWEPKNKAAAKGLKAIRRK